MSPKEILEISATVIASLGGGSAIILGLSKWFGKLWANLILEEEKAKHQKEIEGYKSNLSKELARINAIQDQALYISKNQYDNEYKIYQKIWQSLHQCTLRSIQLYPGYEEVPINEKERESYNEEKYKMFVKTFNDFSTTIEEYAPFYKEELYLAFKDLRTLCGEMGSIFKTEEFDKKYNATFAAVKDEPMSTEDRKRTMELRNLINNKKETLSSDMRTYLNSLKLKE